MPNLPGSFFSSQLVPPFSSSPDINTCIVECKRLKAQDSQEYLQKIIRARGKVIIISIRGILTMCQALGSAFINSHNAPKRWDYYYPHFTDKDTEPQKVRWISPGHTANKCQNWPMSSGSLKRRCHKMTLCPEKTRWLPSFWPESWESHSRAAFKAKVKGGRGLPPQSRMRNKEGTKKKQRRTKCRWRQSRAKKTKFCIGIYFINFCQLYYFYKQGAWCLCWPA